MTLNTQNHIQRATLENTNFACRKFCQTYNTLQSEAEKMKRIKRLKKNRNIQLPIKADKQNNYIF